MANKLRLQILTADSVKHDEEVDMIIMRCIYEDMGRGKRSSVGEIGILPGHMPLSAVLGISPFRIIKDGEESIMAVYGGIVNVNQNTVTVLTEKAEWPGEIDRAMAEAALEQAEREIESQQQDDTALRSNQISLRRALVQVEVSSYPLISRK